MSKNNSELLEETKKLNEENKRLHKQLQEVKEAINLIKTGEIDALVSTERNGLKVYAENTADKTYRILIEKMHEGAVTLNKDGIILYCNSFFANMVRLPLQKAIGRNLNDFIGDLSKEHFEALLKKGWSGAVKEEININTTDGNTIPVLMSINTVELDGGMVLSIILTDLTVLNENQKKIKDKTKQLEWKKAELENATSELVFQIGEKEKRTTELSLAKTDVKELEGLNTHKETVLATLSHDLRSPLTGIIGTAKHLKEHLDTLKQEDVKELLDLLYKASTDELSMLDYLVEWARIKYASEAFSPEKIELLQYVNKVFDTLRKNADEKNISLHNEIKEHESAFADGKMLLSILQNIISNSIKHTLQNGNITVSSMQKDGKIIVEVKDTGIGMSREMQKNLFSPQMNSLSKARKENKGAGIGLLLVKGFLEKNGGEIWVDSEEGKGSSFYFSLPANKLSDKYGSKMSA